MTSPLDWSIWASSMLGENNRRLEVMRAEAIGMLRRHGIELDGETISIHTSNQKLSGKSVDVSQRMRLKAVCANAGILLDS